MPTIKEARNRLTGITGHVAMALWSREDIHQEAKELGIKCSNKEADEILDEMDRKHDATMGISWTTIDHFLEELDYRHRLLKVRPRSWKCIISGEKN